MNIGFISTRLAGHDGVSLEAAKWATVLEQMGHNIFYCAGELEDHGPPGTLIPEAHFALDENMWIRQHSYKTTTAHPELRSRIDQLRAKIKPQIQSFIEKYELDLIIPQNIFAVPLQLPLALALTEIIKETNLPAIAHNHDYYWERTNYQPSCVQDILDSVFPPDLPSIQHVCINSLAQHDLKERRGIDSVVVPNVFDYDTPPPVIDDFNASFRADIGLEEGHFFILEPVRVVHRKGIELAIDLLGKLNDPCCKFVFTHVEDMDEGYMHDLQEQAARLNVELLLVTDRISTTRQEKDGKKIYTLWDAYVHADFVMYPSLYEGFGNALLEAIYFKKMTLVNRYVVYAADIGPHGFEFVEIDGRVTDDAVQRVRELLDNPEKGQTMVEKNYELAQKHFSHTTLENYLRKLLDKIP